MLCSIYIQVLWVHAAGHDRDELLLLIEIDRSKYILLVVTRVFLCRILEEVSTDSFGEVSNKLQLDALG